MQHRCNAFQIENAIVGVKIVTLHLLRWAVIMHDPRFFGSQFYYQFTIIPIFSLAEYADMRISMPNRWDAMA